MKRDRKTAAPRIEPYEPAPEPTSSDDTFATTLNGIEALRAGNYRDEDDWREWKRSVVASIKAGTALEQKMNWVIPEVKSRAGQRAFTALEVRVAALEAARTDAKSTQAKVWSALGKVLLVILGALASRFIKI